MQPPATSERALREEAEHLKRLAEEEKNEHHSKIIWNYLHHHALELAGRSEDIFTPELTVDNPHYETNRLSEGIETFTGEEEIMNGLYSELDKQVTFKMEDNLFVQDGGVISNCTEALMEKGERLIEAGFDVDDPDATYERRFPSAQLWLYNSDAKLIGERLWQIGPYQISKVDPSDVVTIDDQIEVWKDYWPEETDAPPMW